MSISDLGISAKICSWVYSIIFSEGVCYLYIWKADATLLHCEGNVKL